jgi:hypothetical protein
MNEMLQILILNKVSRLESKVPGRVRTEEAIRQTWFGNKCGVVNNI